MAESFNMDDLYTDVTSVPITKNIKSDDEIINMISPVVKREKIHSIQLISDGMYNAIYHITTKDDNNMILKIAPSQTVKVMTHEKQIMENEVLAMEYLQDKAKIPVADVLYFDQSKTKCDSDYFVMSALKGKTFGEQKESMSLRQYHKIEEDLGRLNKELNKLTNTQFGSFVEEKGQSDNWFEIFSDMFGHMLDDSISEKIDLPCEKDLIMGMLERDYGYFEHVKTPALVHWDLWDRNVMIENNKITGILDFEKCFWGDYLMEYGFRKYNQSDFFLKGYGKEEFDDVEKVRIMWYDVYWFIFSLNEGIYRHYNGKLLFQWAKDMLYNKLQELKVRG